MNIAILEHLKYIYHIFPIALGIEIEKINTT